MSTDESQLYLLSYPFLVSTFFGHRILFNTIYVAV